MLEAAKGLVPILVDCSQKGPPELMQKYGVKGYPTVVFTDHTGKEVEKLRGRDPASVKSQIEDVVKKYAVQVFLDGSIDDAKAAAKEQGKLLGVVFMDDDPKSEKKNAYVKAVLLHDELEALRKQFVWVKRPIEGPDGKTSDEAKGYRATKTGTVVLIDPAAEDGDGVIDKITNPKKLKKDLERAIAKHSK